MGPNGGIFYYEINTVQDHMKKFMIQEALSFNHFDNPVDNNDSQNSSTLL